MGAPIISSSGQYVMGLLVRIPDNGRKTGIFVKLDTSWPWIETAKRNEVFEGLTRKYFNRNMVTHYQPTLHLK